MEGGGYQLILNWSARRARVWHVAAEQTQGSESVQEQTHSYEQARDELAEVVRRLEAGNSSLEESLALWERGERLAAICEEWLGGVRARLSEATATEAGQTDPGT